MLEAKSGSFDLLGYPVRRTRRQAGQFGDAKTIAVFRIELERNVLFKEMVELYLRAHVVLVAAASRNSPHFCSRLTKHMRTHFFLAPLVLLAAALPSFAQDGFKTAIVKHLKTSADFSVKVAEAMPESDYDFKLTPAQMSFGGQMTHLSQGLSYFLSAFAGKKPSPAKPKSGSKADIVAFVRQQYDAAIAQVSALTPEQISKTYKEGGESNTGYDLLMGALDHCTNHRASAEMYLRAKGITPPQYEY